MRTSAARSVVESSSPSSAPSQVEPEAPAAVQVAEDGREPVASPARALLERLESGYAEGPEAEAFAAESRWPLYLALPFWAGLSALMWAGVIALVWMLSHRL